MLSTLPSKSRSSISGGLVLLVVYGMIGWQGDTGGTSELPLMLVYMLYRLRICFLSLFASIIEGMLAYLSGNVLKI
jgi:hypothetical protein